MPGTLHVALRPKKYTCERRIWPSLSRPFAAGPASSLFVVVQSVLYVIRTPVTTVVASPVSRPPFVFVGWFLKKNKTGTVLEEIILFAAACCIFTTSEYQVLNFRSFSRFFFSAKLYAPGPHGDRILSTKQPITYFEVK